MDWWIWLLIAVAVVVIVAAVVMAARRRGTERARERATGLRDEAQERAVEAEHTHAAEAGARAQAAEAKLVERHADDLKAEATRTGEDAQERAREAERVDPDQPG
jgi:flagellar biosynthesis/type III secretory pathway M-ring protein FliF/YscJ